MWETTGDGLFHWRKHYYGLWTRILARSKVKNVSMMDLFLTNMQLFSSQDVNWWTGVVWITCGLLWCFYQLFGLSFWRHPFTAEHPLVSKWWNATFLQTWWRNKLIYIFVGLRASTFSANVYFWVNYSLKVSCKSLDHRQFLNNKSRSEIHLMSSMYPGVPPSEMIKEVMTDRTRK